MLGPTSAAVSMTLDARCPLARWRPSSGFRTGECTQPCTAHVMKGENINQWTTASFDFHQMAVHKRTTMLAHCNLKQNMLLCSKQSSFFSFYVLPSGGKSKDAVVHCHIVWRFIYTVPFYLGQYEPKELDGRAV